MGHTMKLDLRLQHDLVAIQTATDLHLMLELTAPADATAANARTPLSLALALDRSGSMGGGRLEAAARAAAFLVDQLHDDDRLAIVTYDNTVQLLAPLDTLDRARLRHLLAGVRPGGSTNLSGGWLAAADELRQRGGDAAGMRRVLLLSDGHANSGITDRARLADVAAGLAADGITTTTIGFGDGLDEDLMTAVADSGRGGAHLAETTDDVPGIFGEEFDALVSLVAQNLTVEVRPGADVEVVEVLNTHPSVGVPGGVQVQVGDAFAGQTIRVVLRLRIPALAGLGLATVGEVAVRWVSVDDAVTQHQVTKPLVVNAVSADEAAQAAEDADVAAEVSVLLAGRAAVESRRLAERGDFDGARQVAAGAVASLRSVDPSHPAAAMIAESTANLHALAEDLADREWSAAASKKMHYESRRLNARKRNHRRPDGERDAS